MNEVKAKLSRLPVSGFKVRLLADQIRGKHVGEALDILTFSNKASARNVKNFSSRQLQTQNIIKV
jgi:large subunit ribosomal protein L22